MSLKTRRTVFQLTPLLDLLLIVIFAQYMDVRQAGARQENWFRNEAEQLVAETSNRADREEAARREVEQELASLRSQYASVREEEIQSKRLRDDLERQRRILGEFVSQTLNLPPEVVEKLLGRESFKDDKELAKSIEMFKRQTTGEAVRHVLSYSEILKRCDIWEFYVDYSPSERKHRIKFKVGEEKKEWLRDGIPPFQQDFVSYVRQRPQPKSLVIILSGFVYEDLTYADQLAYRRLLEQSVFDLNATAGGQTRFYFTDLGFLGEFGLFFQSNQ